LTPSPDSLCDRPLIDPSSSSIKLTFPSPEFDRSELGGVINPTPTGERLWLFARAAADAVFVADSTNAARLEAAAAFDESELIADFRAMFCVRLWSCLAVDSSDLRCGLVGVVIDPGGYKNTREAFVEVKLLIGGGVCSVQYILATAVI